MPGTAPSGSTGGVLTAYDQSDSMMPNQLVTQTTDQSNRVIKRGTDGRGRITSVIGYPNGSASIANHQYDAADNVTSVVQPGAAARVTTYDSLGRLKTAQSPEGSENQQGTAPSGRTKQYGYDRSGNLTSVTDERNITTSLQYDPMSRVLSKTYSDGTPQVIYTYDSSGAYSRGRVTSVSNSISTTNYNAYDPLGRVTSSTQTTNGSQYVFPSYQYNLAGGLKSLQYPSGRVVTTGFDNLNRPVTIGQSGNSTSYVSATVYVRCMEPCNK